MIDQNTTKNRSGESRQASQSGIASEPTLGDVATDAVEGLRQYAIRRPEVVAAWCFGVGFVLGWKLKPW